MMRHKELFLIKALINRKAIYTKALTLDSFDSNKLLSSERKLLIQDLKRLNINFSNKSFGLLGQALADKTNAIALLGQKRSESYMDNYSDSIELKQEDYLKLGYGSVMNSAGAVADIFGIGVAAKAMKTIPLLNKFHKAFKLSKFDGVLLKAPKGLTTALELLDSKKFLFLTKLIEAKFIINDELEGIINSDEATAQMVNLVVGSLIPSTFADNKNDFIAIFIDILDDIISGIITGGVDLFLIDDETFIKAYDELVTALPEFIPYAGSFVSQWRLGKDISDDRSNSTEASNAWDKYLEVTNSTINRIKYMTELGISKKLDFIMNSYVKQINEYDNQKLKELQEKEQYIEDALSQQLQLTDVTKDEEMVLYISKDVDFYDEIMDAISLQKEFRTYYDDGNDRKYLSLTYDESLGGFKFTSPLSGTYKIFDFSIPQDREEYYIHTFQFPSNTLGISIQKANSEDNSGGTTNPPITVTPTSVKKTGQTTSYIEHDDGAYQAGVNNSYTRDDNKNIVTDNITGLQWQDDEEAKTITKRWVTQANYDARNYSDTSGDTAITYCHNLSLGEHTDWRLPSKSELLSIVDYGRYSSSINPIFENIYSSLYWSSTTTARYTYGAWYVYFGNGYAYSFSKYHTNRVRCVRAGQ